MRDKANTFDYCGATLQLSPVDTGEYYFWPAPSLNAAFFFTFNGRFPDDLYLTSLAFHKLCNGTIGSPEFATLDLVEVRPVDGLNYYSGSGSTPSGTQNFRLLQNITFNNTTNVIQEVELFQPVFKNCLYAFKLNCPTWATNPTQVFFNIHLRGINQREYVG